MEPARPRVGGDFAERPSFSKTIDVAEPEPRDGSAL
jgi:hypothetical protein